jgi:chromosome segregation ATPase
MRLCRHAHARARLFRTPHATQSSCPPTLMATQIAAARARAAELEAELSRERARLMAVRGAEKTVVDLTTGMSIEAKRQIEEMQRRNLVLERQVAKLKRDAVDGGGDTPSGKGTGSRPGTAGPPPPPPPPADTAQSERSASAVAHWEETKKLNVRVDGLRKKLAAKGEELEAAIRDGDKARLQGERLQSELDRQAAAIRELQGKLSRSQAAGVRPSLDPDGSKLKAATVWAVELEEQVADLKAALARAERHAAVSSSSSAPGHASAEELFEARLARDAAVAAAARLRARLTELFGPGAEYGTGTTGGGTGARRGTGGGGGLTSAREAELLSAIANLKTALEKASSGSVPSSKYMSEVSRRKEAAAGAAAAGADADKLRAQSVAAARMLAELQANNASLRSQLRTSSAGGSRDAVKDAHAASLEQLLARREAEVSELRQAVAARDAALAAAPSQAHGSDLASLREQVSELAAENADLKSELNAFDPAFFEEIEDMKHEHHMLGTRVVQYEDMVRELTASLGRPLPPGLAPR